MVVGCRCQPSVTSGHEGRASSGLPLGSQTIECRLRLACHAPDDLACWQNLADVARALSGSQASLLDVAVEIARRQDGAIARHRDRLAVEDRRANELAFRIPTG